MDGKCTPSKGRARSLPLTNPSMRTAHKLALARLASKGLLFARGVVGLGATTQVTRGGLKWQLDLHEGIDLAIYLFGRFERSTWRAYSSLVGSGDAVLDIGANIGAHTLPLARLVGPHGRVFAFEPTRYALAKLQTNIALNPELAGRIISEQIMLADRDQSPVAESLPSSWPLRTGTAGHPQHGGVAQSTMGARSWRVDTYMESHAIQRLRLIKLDVDGHEHRVLSGAAATLHRFRPILILEIAPYLLREYGSSVGELSTLLHALNYRLRDEASGRPLPPAAQLEAMIPEGASLNVIAEPA